MAVRRSACSASQGGTPNWCSLQLRFDRDELERLRAAEDARGRALATRARPADLDLALVLARAGRKLAAASPGSRLVLAEDEVRALLDATRQAGELSLSSTLKSALLGTD